LFKVQSLRCSIAVGVQGSIASLFNCLRRSIASRFKVQLPAAFKVQSFRCSLAVGVQGSIASLFKVQLLRYSIACGVQSLRCSRFNCLRRSRFNRCAVQWFAVQLPAVFKVQSLRCSIACGVQGSIALRFNGFAVQCRWLSLFKTIKIIALAVLNHFKFEQP